MHHRTALITAVGIAFIGVACVHAQTTLNQSGSWTNPAIWSAGVPASGTLTHIRNNHTATLHTGNFAESGELRVGSTDAGTLTVEGGSLTASSHIRVGHNTAGTLNIVGGDISNSDNQLTVAYLAGSSGMVEISAGTLTVGPAQLGREGPGTMNLSGGVFTATSSFSLGQDSAGYGVIHQTGGQFIMDGTANLVVGVSGNGEYHISGGSFETTRGLLVGNSAGNGTFRVSGTDPGITLRDFTVGANGTYIVDIDEAGNGVTPVIADSPWDVTLAGTLVINSTGDAVPSSVVLFQTQGSGRIEGAFDHVQWNDELSGEVVYTHNEVRLERLIRAFDMARVDPLPGGGVSTSVPSASGWEYTLWYTRDLTGEPVEWTPAQTLAGTGAPLTLIDPDPEDPMRIYQTSASVSSPANGTNDIPDWSILLLHYGQSNAGITPSGGLIEGVVLEPNHVLMPNDGRGVRGWLGNDPTTPVTALVPVDETVMGGIQSVVAPAGGVFAATQTNNPPMVIVRSEAKGGQKFIGEGTNNVNQIGLHLEDDLVTKTVIYHNLINTITAIVERAATAGYPVDTIYIPFTHQEADRSAPRETYLAQLQYFIADVETDLAPLSIPVVWLLDEAAGTTGEGSGNRWPNRLALQDAADAAANVHLIGPRYPYPIYDVIHWTNEGKALYGELLGLAIAALRDGQAFHAPRLASVNRTGAVITLTFESLNPLTFDESQFTINNSVKGFTLDRVTNTQIESVELTGLREVTVTLGDEPTGTNMRIRYAYRPRVDSELGDTGWAVGNGALRETWSVPSLIIPGKVQYRWALCFEEPID